jgi:poly(3-hydroxybutyrate) depolymerase
LLEGGASISRMERPLVVIGGIESQRAAIDRRLAKIQGHDSAKATVRWPYDMARIVNLGVRKLNSADFGLREDRYNSFDFVKEMRESQGVLKALEAGKDSVLHAKGDNERHYWFEAAGEIMPYRLYVPLKWDGKAKLKMMFVLHGNSRDHDFYFDRDNQILSKLAEKYGWLVVCPMGYRPNAGYNAGNLRNLPGAGAPPERGGGRGGRGGFDPARLQRQSELSEMDAMNVLDLVQKEYPIDLAHVYLFGHSAGGTGGWYIAAKYPEKFAGIALSAFGTRPETYPFDRIKGKALMVIVGTKDAPNTVATVRAMDKALGEKGYDHQFLEVQDATHDTIVGLAEPTVFEFFDKHSRK